MNAEQNLIENLIPPLGVYGYWLILYGMLLDKNDPEVRRIMAVYEMYYRSPDSPTAGMLMGAIDVYVRNHPDQSIPASMDEGERRLKLRNQPTVDKKLIV
jgi:hypothetical protein